MRSDELDYMLRAYPRCAGQILPAPVPKEPPMKPVTLLIMLAGVPNAPVMESMATIEERLQEVDDTEFFSVTELLNGKAVHARYRAGLVAGILDISRNAEFTT